MKSLFYLFAVMLLVGGCSYKNEAIKLSSYNAQYTGESSKEKKSVYVESIKDARSDKHNIGYIMKNGEKVEKLFSNDDFEKKYREGLSNALHMAGFKSGTLSDNPELVININIKKIQLVHNDKSFDKNLKGEIALEVIIKKGNETVTQNFKQKASKWISPSYSSKDMEPFLNELFSDSINGIVSRLTQH